MLLRSLEGPKRLLALKVLVQGPERNSYQLKHDGLGALFEEKGVLRNEAGLALISNDSFRLWLSLVFVFTTEQFCNEKSIFRRLIFPERCRNPFVLIVISPGESVLSG